jgi:hypothetical protein
MKEITKINYIWSIAEWIHLICFLLLLMVANWQLSVAAHCHPFWRKNDSIDWW